MITLRPPVLRPVIRPRYVRLTPRASWQEGLALTGKFLGLFVLFSSSMNWWRYKRDREDREK